MSEKKRKRRDEGGERPKKKAATVARGDVQVELLENKGVLGPLLAVTPGLKLPPKIVLNPYKQTKILPDGDSTELLLHSSQHPRLDYSAQEEHDGSSESQLKDYIGVFDPATNKLQLMPVRRVTVRSALRSEAEELRQEQAQLETAKRYALAAEFGSKKSKKALEARTLNAIKSTNGDEASEARSNAVAETVLQNIATSTSTMPTKVELAAVIDSSKPRPTPNLAAEYPADVYTVETVVGNELMTMLEVKSWIEASEAGIGVEVGSLYVAKRIVKLAKNKQIQKLRALHFILLCVNFNAALQGGGNQPKKVPVRAKLEALMGKNADPGCIMAIRRKFVNENGAMPRWNIDNLLTHVAAASLIVDDFEVDVNDLREDLKLENKEIRQYFAELGCRISPPTQHDMASRKFTKAEGYNHHIARLKLPLVFPKPAGMAKKKR